MCYESFGFSLCFPGTSCVNVAGKGWVQMKMLQPGDQVECFNTALNTTCWSPVLSFLHREPEKLAQYLVIQYHHPSHGYGTITASHDHLLYLVEQGEMVAAASLVTGQHLVVSKDGQLITVEVTQSSDTVAEGVYAPLTSIGTVIVDGVVASCYTAVGHSQQSIHKAFKPLRMVGDVNPSLAAHKGGETSDIHWYAKFLRGIQRVVE
jgi:hypothetical protein